MSASHLTRLCRPLPLDPKVAHHYVFRKRGRGSTEWRSWTRNSSFKRKSIIAWQSLEEKIILLNYSIKLTESPQSPHKSNCDRFFKDHYAAFKCGFDANREGKTPPLSWHHGAAGASRHPHQGPPITVVNTGMICPAYQDAPCCCCLSM